MSGSLGMKVVAIFLIAAFTFMVVGYYYLSQELIPPYDPNAVQTGEYLPDPTLSQLYSPSDPYQINYIRSNGSATYGNSSSFSGMHHIASSANDYNYIDLIWNHYAGDEPDFVLPFAAESQVPDTNNFIYFTESFNWTYDRLPNDAVASVNLSVFVTGDFATQDDGNLMFKIYVWLIDSSGNWRMIYKSSPPYTTVVQQRVIDLDYFDLTDAFGGMVDDGNGQEDPTDILTFAVGLAPTRYFYNHYDAYNGTVTARLSSISLYVYGE